MATRPLGASFADWLGKPSSSKGLGLGDGRVALIVEMLANVNLAHDLKLLAAQGRVVVIGSRGDVTISGLLYTQGSCNASFL